jgi:hypothetical protein
MKRWAWEIAMGMKSYAAAPAAALALGLFLIPPASIATSLVAAVIGNLSCTSPAMGEPAALTRNQSDALSTYNNSRNHFEQILGQRRAQIN